jgi:serine/threonine protein phosphatase PrpC
MRKVGPWRVYEKDSNFPGLAMSRSLGDTKAHDCGVTEEPEVKTFDIKPDRSYILIIASDGLWEQIPNNEVLSLAMSTPINDLPNTLAEEAVALWKKNDRMVDDTTVVVIKIN